MSTIRVPCAFMLAGIALAAVSCSTFSRPKPGVEVWEVRSAWSVLNIHSGPKPVLKVHGKKFPNVQGCNPYFVSVPNKNWIVFVTERKGADQEVWEGDEIHVYDLDAKVDSIFLTRSEGSGISIGCQQRSESVAHSEISWASTNELVVKSVIKDVEESWHLDLISRRVSKIVRVEYEGGRTNVFVYPGR